MADGNKLEHRSKRFGTLRMDPVREISLAKQPNAQGGRVLVVKVAHGEGESIGSSSFMDVRSRLRPRASTEQLASELRELFGAGSATPAEDMQRLRAAEESRKRALSAAVAKRGRTRMWIGGIAAVAGLIATAVSYNAASSGGTYFVFWGAVVFGALWFVAGLAEFVTNRGALAPPRAGAADRPSRSEVTAPVSNAVSTSEPPPGPPSPEVPSPPEPLAVAAPPAEAVEPVPPPARRPPRPSNLRRTNRRR